MHGTTFVKKKRFWPKHANVQERVDDTQGKEVGTTRVRKGACINVSNNNDLYLVALVHNKHAYLMLTNWYTTIRNGNTKKRRIGLELVEFNHGEAQTNYYCGRHAVDDNNNNRQGCLSFEDSFIPTDWNKSQFGCVMQTCQTNSHLENAHFSNSEVEKPLVKPIMAEDWPKS